MVRRQLIARGIRDERVLEAFELIPRHLYVDASFVDRAYEDAPLPIADRQTISQPYIVAYMIEALGLDGREKVLEIGTGSGYQTAVLSHVAGRVLSVERSPRLGRTAEKLLADQGCHNVLIRIADGTHGWAEESPFDAIVVSAAAPEVPDPYLRQLAVGGRLVIPVGDEEKQFVYRIRRTRAGYEEERMAGCRFVKLIGRYGWEANQ
ncbi:MAG: protein-L-isoaspartate(D-aspartate) O-methyltransferase [Deltaproteobacteria bacterium]|nr:protein-L-isoaspartate(D-aspartate) O-methyltransferase [Deltaproteobacteria bacterium]